MKKINPYLILVIITLIVGFPLLRLDMLNGDDAVFHLFRAGSLLEAIKDGQFIPMVNPNMFNDLGYSTNIFYGVLPIYIINLIYLFTPTFGAAINVCILLSLFLSGFFMYKMVLDIFKDEKVALISAIFYIVFPYHLYDIYVRMALGEIIAFVFIPLVFHGLYSILNGGNKWYLLVFGASFLLLTHNVSAYIVALFCFIYLILNYKKINKVVIKKILISLILIVLFSLITLGPLFEAKSLDTYMVFDDEYMHSSGKDMLIRAFKTLFNFFNPVNLILLFFLILTLIVLIKIENKKYNDFLILIVISLILALGLLPWNILPDILSLPQFPFRYLLIVSFFLPIVLALIILKLKKQLKIFIIVLTSISVLPFLVYGVLNEGVKDDLLTHNQIRLHKGAVHSTGSAGSEYLPKEAIYNYDYLKNRGNLPLVLSGDGVVSSVIKDGTKLNFEINVLKKSEIELPYIYYPGYIVLINGENATYYETSNGLLGINLNKGDYDIEVYYRGSNIMIISYGISLISMLIFCGYLFKKMVLLRN